MDDFKKVKKIVKVLTQCSDSDARLASQKICQDHESIALLALACAGATSSTAIGVRTAVAAGSTGIGLPGTIGALVFAGASGVAARRFCSAVVRQTGNSINNSLKQDFKNSLAY